jgi:hypothetical protein
MASTITLGDFLMADLRDRAAMALRLERGLRHAASLLARTAPRFGARPDFTSYEGIMWGRRLSEFFATGPVHKRSRRGRPAINRVAPKLTTRQLAVAHARGQVIEIGRDLRDDIRRHAEAASLNQDKVITAVVTTPDGRHGWSIRQASATANAARHVATGRARLRRAIDVYRSWVSGGIIVGLDEGHWSAWHRAMRD